MDVVEQAEQEFRLEVLAALDRPGPSPRARLFAALKEASARWRTVPILRALTRSDYEQLCRRVPAGKLREHLASDQAFAGELVVHCRSAGIPITAPTEEIDGLLHAIFLYEMHKDELGADSYPGASDLILELTAAFCLGEVRCDLALGTAKDQKHGAAN